MLLTIVVVLAGLAGYQFIAKKIWKLEIYWLLLVILEILWFLLIWIIWTSVMKYVGLI